MYARYSYIMDIGTYLKTQAKYKMHAILFGTGCVCGGLLGCVLAYAGMGGTTSELSGISCDDAVVVADAVDDGCTEGMWVDVSGAVVVPGVHCIPAGAIVEDAIHTADGLTDTFCSSWASRNLNRAQVVTPNSKLYVPFISDSECTGVERFSEGSSGGSGLCAGGKVNINSASSAELESIPGVGPSTAKKIIEGRPFDMAEGIMDVSGIGEKTYESMKEYICL